MGDAPRFDVFAAIGRTDVLDLVGSVNAEDPRDAIRACWAVATGERFVVIDRENGIAHVFKAPGDDRLKRVLAAGA